MSKQVFISYARTTSQPAATAVRDALEAAGISVFLDERDIPPGGQFPHELADALLDARVVLIFAEAAYFERPWCVYEYRVAMAPARVRAPRADNDGSLDHVVVALPRGEVDSIAAHLPPSLARRAWPLATQPGKLVTLVKKALRGPTPTLAERLQGVDDDAVKALRTGGSVPSPKVLAGCRGFYRAAPRSLKEAFAGRADLLWRIFHTLETRRAGQISLSCALHGGAGAGKTQLAAEYLCRYGPTHYPGGLVWIDADGDAESLAQQLRQVLHAFDAKAPAPRSGEDLVAAVEQAVAAVARADAVLWIVDNVPQPRADAPMLTLASWCPPWRHVSLLCTSHWKGLRPIDDHIQVDELAMDTAIEMLTRPPVERAWLSGQQWARIVEWVGALPLALQTLRASLVEGFADAAELVARASVEEAAAAVDAQYDAIRGEVVDEHLRGVTGALQVSYAQLATAPRALAGAHLVARLSPFPIASGFLAQLVDARERGVLANRSWLQSTDGQENRPAERYWRMHRIYASYLRGRSVDPEAELRDLAAKVEQMCRTEGHWSLLKEHSTHVVVLAQDFERRAGDAGLGAKTIASAARLAQALVDGPAGVRRDDSVSIRSRGAELADRLGIGDALVVHLRKTCLEGDAAVCGMTASLLGDMPRTRSAAELLAELLRDPREDVRRETLRANLPSRHADILALPALEAILCEPARDDPLHQPYFFSNILEEDVPALPNEVMTRLADRLDHAVAAERQRAIGMLTSIHRKMTDFCEPDDPRLDGIVTTLRNAALRCADSDVATAAARALGASDEAATYAALVSALEAAEPGAPRLRAVTVLGEYLRGAEDDRLIAPRIEWRDGQQSMRVWMPERREADPALFGPLVACAVDAADPAVMRRALTVLLESKGGDEPLAGAIAELYERGPPRTLLLVADAAVEAAPEHPNGHWWRGIAAEALGDPDTAMASYGKTIERLPEFVQPYSRRADLRAAAGDLAGALADLDTLLSLTPNDPQALFRRARVRFDGGAPADAITDLDAAIAIEPAASGAFLLKGECLSRLDRFPEAIDALSTAIDLGRPFAFAFHLRAYARANVGELRGALADIEKVYEIEPGYTSATELRDALRKACADLPPDPAVRGKPAAKPKRHRK